MKNNVFFLLLTLLVVMPLSATAMESFPIVRLQSLDKATARTQTFNVEVGKTVKLGPLYIRPQECKKSSPLETPESATFLQIWEFDAQDESQWVFSGWMFASSPGLSPMEHPIHDVWVLDCIADKKVKTEKVEPDAEPEIIPADENQDLLED